MLINYFSEQPYSALSQEEAWKLHDFDHPARRPGDGKLKVIGDAPGEYVKVKAQ